MTFSKSTDESADCDTATDGTSTSRIEEFDQAKTEAKQLSMSQDTTTSADVEPETKVKKTRDDWDEIDRVIRNVSFVLFGTALFIIWMLQYDKLPSIAQNVAPVIAVALMGAGGVTGLSGMFRK